MLFFSGKHLRVTSFRTINGTTPDLDENGMAKTKVDVLPMSAKKYLEDRNKELPEYLRKKIEVVGGEEQQQPTKKQTK